MSKDYSIVIPAYGKIAPITQLFLFVPHHTRFLLGVDKYFETTTYPRALFLPIVLAVIFLLFGFAQSDAFAVALIFAIGFLALGTLACWQVSRNRHLCRNGKLIQGRIIDYQAGKSPEIMGLFGFLIYREVWGINVLCGFRNPDGKVISKRIRMQRNDLADQDVNNGTPIVILYLNDRRYKIL